MATTEQSTSEVDTAVRNTLASHKSMYLATSGSDGPWVGGVYFAENDPFTLLVALEVRGRTLKAIKENPLVAVVLATGSPLDAFLQGRAAVTLLDEEADNDVRRRIVEKVPAAAPFMELPVHGIKLTIVSWRMTDVSKGWIPGLELANPDPEA